MITPAPDLKDGEVDLSYNTFLELFKYKIIYYLMKYENMSLSKAYDTWKNAIFFNEKVYNIMMDMIRKHGVSVLINRNPTLNYYSMLTMRIRDVKPTDEDFTLSVPLSILPGLNADFDGDIINIIGLESKELRYMFRKFEPTKYMLISRDNAMINDYFSITKSQLIDLCHFCTIGATDNDRPEIWVRDKKIYDVHGNILANCG